MEADAGIGVANPNPNPTPNPSLQEQRELVKADELLTTDYLLLTTSC